MRKTLSIILVLFLLQGLFVMGAGSSTGYSTKKKESVTVHEEASPEELIPPMKKSCEEYAGMQARIKCRLEENDTDAVTEESCRVVSDKDRCIALYREVGTCYGLSGTGKDKCFKKIARFTHVTIQQQANEKGREPIKNYLVFLLYDLQERAEEAHEGGRLTNDEAASIITAIVETKQAILLDKPKAEIESRMVYLKQQWARYMA
jgi:hypothetical protein